ncbi:cobW-domain-containing protein [Ascodesmis nigricans]|uniref:CobW-domain-containing protein n=1 Tax=Ascodesmis nigricans TaxID=341454 RepID=A0A4S2MP02_9PEZI|nr:cobW-domain-containing protein [Ascodesmis nigricans]
MTGPISITILTGFLGSGKTTLLLSLLPQLPPSYKLCLLKNEFGDVAVDSQLAGQSSVTGVTELLNGCICCNLVGQLSDALLELKENYKPTRIVIETSGSAFPATLAMEVNRISRETFGAFTIDGVIQVVDVENWTGYEDTSYTAKLQAKYTDLIVLNKHELAGPQKEDTVIDRIRDVAEETPIVRTDKGWIDRDVVFGLDSQLSKSLIDSAAGLDTIPESQHEHHHAHSSEVDVISLKLPIGDGHDAGYIDTSALEKLLTSAPKDEVYRIKGIVRCRMPPPIHPDTPPTPAGSDIPTSPPVGGRWILNWAFGRWTVTPLRESTVSTTIEAPETTASSPVDVAPNCEATPNGVHVEDDAAMAKEALKARKGSIEVVVETEIRTTVEATGAERGDAARLSFVLARGEGNKWLRKLKGPDGGVRYDREGGLERLEVTKVV